MKQGSLLILKTNICSSEPLIATNYGIYSILKRVLWVYTQRIFIWRSGEDPCSIYLVPLLVDFQVECAMENGPP